jgi:hypothetical protein
MNDHDYLFRIHSDQTHSTQNCFLYQNIPGESIWPVDAVVFDRTRIRFHRNPTFFIKNRSDPRDFLSDSFQSDSDPDFLGVRRNPIKSGSDLVGFQSRSAEFRENPRWNPTERNPTKTLSDPIEIISVRRDPIPLSHRGISSIIEDLNLFLSLIIQYHSPLVPMITASVFFKPKKKYFTQEEKQEFYMTNVIQWALSNKINF